MVKRSRDQTGMLTDIRNKERKIVSYFRLSTTAEEELAETHQ